MSTITIDDFKDKIKSNNILAIRMIFFFNGKSSIRLTDDQIDNIIENEISVVVYLPISSNAVAYIFENGVINIKEIGSGIDLKTLLSYFINYPNLQHELDKFKLFKVMENI